VFTPERRGETVVRGLLFEENGWYYLNATDTVVDTANDSVIVEVSPPPEIKYRMYDLFEQRWGDWWPWRLIGWKTDIILSNRPHEYTFVYNPDTRNLQGIIYAPYRWNMSAVTMSVVNVHDPEFMPVWGTPGVPGAAADMHIWFEYLDNESFFGYWKPTWETNWNWSGAMDNLIIGQLGDGYFLGTLYTVTMNREAALEWIGIPAAGDPLAWWEANNNSYMQAWQDWIMREGNLRLDIWPAYEWTYVDMGTMMDLVEEPDGDLTLRIAHFSWGYEILMLRWLNETSLCIHEPYMEDFNMSVHYAEGYSDIYLDAVAQYNLHAVKANGTENAAAWVWEPQRVDYEEYSNDVSGYVSEFNPWVYLSYNSWNSGDGYFNTSVPYDSTPQWFNLTSYMTFEIQLPQRSDVIGYKGEWLYTARTAGAIYLLKRGNDSAYENITVRGPMTLGYNMTGTGPGAVNLWDYYDPVQKKLTLVGPLNFDNYHHENGRLYHSAPWIEFNVENVTWGPPPGLTMVTAMPGASDVPLPGSSLSGDAAISEVAALAVVLCGIVMTVAIISRDVSGKE
jgi:hypothetical protein